MFGNTFAASRGERSWWFLFSVAVILTTANLSQSPSSWASVASTPQHSLSSISTVNSSYDSGTLLASSSFADTIRAVSLSPKPHPREAAAGYPLYYSFTVSNLGNVSDQYSLAATGNQWPLTLLSADSTTKISSTGVVPVEGQFEFVVKLEVPSNARIGATDTARIVVRSLTVPSVSDFAAISTMSLGPAAVLPWTESFPQAALEQARWPYNLGPAVVNAEALNEPSPQYALNFDGYSLGGDEVRSQPINLAGKRDVVLQFAFERGGDGNAPEKGDDFFVDYFNDDGEWINLLILPGGDPAMTNFRNESVILPADAYHSSFRFRLRSVSSPPGPFDDWYIDDVNLFEVKPARIPFVETFPTPALSANKWPVNIGAQVDTLGRNAPSPPFSLNLRGNTLLQSQPLDLSGESAVSVRYYFQQGGFGDEPELGDDLLLEFRDANANWIVLAQHLGSAGGSSNFTRFEVVLPSVAYHRDFRLRFRALGSPGFDDWFVDDLTIDVFSPPEIDVTPATLATTLFVNDTTSRNFVVSNTGPGDLFYRIRFAPPAFPLASKSHTAISASWAAPGAKYPENYYQAELKKYEYDWREGLRVLSSRGGPDSFGYTWRDSRELDGPAFKWEDISGIGTRIQNIGDDDNVGPFKIGFAFPFYDSVFTTFRFCTNGFISFTSSSAKFGNDPLPGVAISDLVAPFWSDLDLTTGAAYYYTDGKKLIVQWTNAVRAGGGGPYTFQLLLTPQGNIGFQYLKMDAPTNFSTIGIQNHDGSEGLEIAFNTDYVRDSLAVRIERPASWLSFTPTAAMLAAGAQTVVRVKFNAAGLIPDSTYHTELHVESNDVDEPVVPVQIALEVIKQPDSTKHFPFDTTNVRYVINIDDATLDDRRLDAGDEIAVFTPAGRTAGAIVWKGSGPARLMAYGDDSLTTAVEGFKRGETMFFRIWDRTGGDQDYPATPTYTRGDGRFGTGDSARISLLAARTRFTHRMTMRSGWSWISFNVLPEDRDVANLMAGVKNLAIMVNGEGKFYIPGQINGIGELNVLEGYKVFLNARDSVKVTGQEVYPTTPIPLRATWNFVSFLPVVPIRAEAALASVLDQLEIAKNDEGKFFVPGLINTLATMQPGSGYRLYLKMADTLRYPFGGSPFAKALLRSRAQVPVTSVIPPKHFAPILMTAESYSLVILNASIDGKPLQIGDEIGVFTPDGRLVGAGVWSENRILGIAAWRKDDRNTPSSISRQGFVPGENMIFRLWRSGGFEGRPEEEEILATAQFLRGDGTFGSEVFSILELHANPPERSFGLPQQYRLYQSFPNPLSLSNSSAAAPMLVRYELPQPGFVELRIYNLLGQVVRTLQQAPASAGYHQVLWDGRDDQGRLVAGGIYLYRLRVRSDRNDNEFVAMRKVVIVP